MKKLYTTPDYKVWHNRKLKKIDQKFQREAKLIEKGIKKKKRKGKKIRIRSIYQPKPIILASYDLRLIENTEECLAFFRDLRSENYLNKKGKVEFVVMSLKQVEFIDYASISILTAISDDLKSKGIILRGDFPDNLYCKKFIIDSGFLNHMFDEKTKRPFPKAEKSDLIFFEKGCGKLSVKDNINISTIVKNVVQHLIGELSQCPAVKTILLEICGNSIEWSDTKNKQWLLGVQYESDRVIFTVTDVGKGIIETLHRKFSIKLADIFLQKSNHQILKGAFEQKYGSSSQEVNRNKGLPSVKYNSDQQVIRDLKVITNNVILHFDNEIKSRTFPTGSARFRGTFYQWEMTKECFTKILMN